MRIILLTSFIVLTSILGFGQDDRVIEKIDGVKVYVHVVEPGHTLYAISKKYNISIEDIIANNNGVEESLTVGRKIYIPIKLTDKKENKKNTTAIADGTIIHTVSSGETLFAISRKYNISINEIKSANPDLNESISIGQSIVIPIQNVKVEKEEYIKPASGTATVHIVQPKETIYSIANLYSITQTELIESNPHIISGLKAGEALIIPVKEVEGDSIVENEEVVESEEELFRGKYKIALMLPFFLEKNKILRQNVQNADKKLYSPTKDALRFMIGVKLALDSLEKEGFKYDLTLFDTENDSNRVRSFFEDKKKYDLIIGPMTENNFKEAVNQASLVDTKMQLVCPLSHNNRLLLGNTNIAKIKPSITTEIEVMSAFVADSFRNDNVIIIETGIEKEQHQYSVAEKNIRQLMLGYSGNVLQAESFKKLKLAPNFKFKLSKEVMNVIVVPSNDQAVVSSFVNEIKKIRNLPEYSQCKFTFVGLEGWQKFKNVEPDIKVEFNWMFTSSYFVDYNDFRTQEVVNLFRNNYNTDPQKIGLLGFDISMHFFSEFLNNKSSSFNKLNESTSSSVLTPIKLVQTGEENGYENRSLYILKYDNYQLKRVR